MYRVNMKCLFYIWERRRYNERPWSPRLESCWCPAEKAKFQDMLPWAPKMCPPLTGVNALWRPEGQGTVRKKNMVDFKVIKERAGKSIKQGE